MINTHTDFAPLKKTWVGKCYPPEFFDYIKHTETRQLIQKICEETTRDLESFKALLTRFKVEIEEPDIVLTANDARLMLKHKIEIPRPPLSPRDNYLALGHKLYRFANDASYDALFKKYSKTCEVFDPYNNESDFEEAGILTIKELERWWYKDEVYGDEFTKKHNMKAYQKENVDKMIRTHLLPAASINKCGNHLTVEQLPKMIVDWVKQEWSDYDLNFVTTGGHVDGCFATINQGLLMTTEELDQFSDSFPDWDIIYLGDQGNRLMAKKSYWNQKKLHGGKWYCGEVGQETADFINSWLTDWTGYVEETVFDINSFVIDPKNVVFNGYNEKLFEVLSDRYGIIPHCVHFKHRYFWDGGWHCNTVDIVRDDKKEDYLTLEDNKQSVFYMS